VTIRKKLLLVFGVTTASLVVLVALVIQFFPVARLVQFRQGGKNVYLIPIAGLIILSGVILVVLIEKLILSRVNLLSEKVVNLKPDTFFGKLSLPGRDELSLMAEGINRIMQALGASREQLREQEEQVRQLFHDGLSANFVADPGGGILLCNRNFASLFGYDTLKEALTANIFSFFPSREARDAHLEELRKKKKLEARELELVKPDRSRLQVIANIRGGFNDQGELVQIQGHLFDIS
jgi:PAS domain S-box-containing protein